MLSIHVRIDRAQRLLRMLEQDVPLLALRVAELTPKRQQSAKGYAAQLTAHARAELEKLSGRGLLLGLQRSHSTPSGLVPTWRQPRRADAIRFL